MSRRRVSASPSQATFMQNLEARCLLSYGPQPLGLDADPLVYDGPLVIDSPGTYSGNWRSLSPDVPAVLVNTPGRVIIENSQIRSAGACIAAVGGGEVIIRNTSGYGLNPGVRGRYVGRFIEADGFTSLRVEHNYLAGTAGIYATGYTGNHSKSQTVKVLYNEGPQHRRPGQQRQRRLAARRAQLGLLSPVLPDRRRDRPGRRRGGLEPGDQRAGVPAASRRTSTSTRPPPRPRAPSRSTTTTSKAPIPAIGPTHTVTPAAGSW